MATVSTKHVVLGLLIERPGYGYELQQRLDGRFRFLGFSNNAVYGALDRLRRDGLIEPVGVKQAGRTERGAPRVIYAPTAGGTEEFSRWLGEPCEIGVAREEVQVKLVLSKPLHWPRVLAMAEKLEQACLAAIRELQDAGRPSLEELMGQDSPEDVIAAVLVDDAECLRLQAMIEWLQRVRVFGQKCIDPPVRRA
jgi:DNA-binding PadR family transcriptional regulator